MGYDYQTSHPAFKDDKNRDYCRREVFGAIRKLGECNDKAIADFLKWPINRVTPRRGELVDNGLVECAGKKKDPESNRLVNYWKEHKISPTAIQPELFT